jgi:hypothetical protein
VSFATTHDAMAEQFASSASAMFPDLCTVRAAQATTSSATGGKVRPATSVHASVPCLYKPLRASERGTGEGSNAFADYEIVMPAVVSGSQVTVAPKHQIVVAARGEQPARTFEVVGVLNVSGVYLKCLAALKN